MFKGTRGAGVPLPDEHSFVTESAELDAEVRAATKAATA